MSLGQEQATETSAFGAGDRARFWRVPRYDELECLAARFETYRYAPHVHETFAVAAIIDGAERYRYRGVTHVAPAGSVGVVHPGVLHDGGPAGDSFVYRVLYPSPDLFRRIATDLNDGVETEPWFPETVIDDPELAVRIARLHRTLERSPVALEQDSALIQTLGLLIRRHSRTDTRPPAVGREDRLVDRLCSYIDGHLGEDVTLDDLARDAGLSRFHLLRVFRHATGITPHVYLMSRRVARAKRLLGDGQGLAETAVDCGFFDQSHFTRVFKSHVGVTPGHYRTGSNPVQDAAA
ncbi:MAG: AraC family transcriptional regulator [Alphaproteobacteria bacterium]|nr:AraC family transcriptional regulator [Alphaproteobacteria bacterium]